MYDLLKNKSFTELIHNKYKYTEHNKRYGTSLQKDSDVFLYLSNNVKSLILKEMNEECYYDKLNLNDVHICVDDAFFKIGWHEDTHEKYISCVLYCGNGFNGTSFLNEDLKEHKVEAMSNRLVFFKSKKTIHCVKKNINKRFSLQFNYSFN